MSDQPALINPRSQQMFLEALNGIDGQDNYGFGFLKNIKLGGGGDSWKKKPTLRKGAKGADVEDLQGKLGIKADGDFGSGTEKAVKQFQLNNGLPSTGVVDSDTWAVLYGKSPKAERQAKTAQTVADISSIGTQLLSSFTGGQPQEQVAMTVVEEEEAGMPWGWIIGGTIAVVALGVGGWYFFIREEEEE